MIDNKSLLKSNILFQGLSDSELELIAGLAEERVFQPEEYIIQEGEVGNELYLIKSGQVKILKKAIETGVAIEFTLSQLSAGETIGEIALLENTVRTASACATTETVVLVLPITILKELSAHQKQYQVIQEQLKQLEINLSKPSAYATMALNLARSLSKRLLNTNEVTAEALRKELQLSEMRINSGRFLIVLISIMVIYSYCLSAIPLFANKLPSTSLVTLPLLLLYTGAVLFCMFTSGYSLSFYGLTLKNWKWSLIEGILWSIPAILFTLIMKWIIVQARDLDVPLIQGYKVAFENLSPLMIGVLIAAYLLLTPLQELIVRGGVQSSLQQFLSGKYRIVMAIIVSNLIFSMTHLHMSLAMGFFVLLYGIYWGFLYARQGNIIGVSVSHLIVGGFGFFIIGVEAVLGVNIG